MDLSGSQYLTFQGQILLDCSFLARHYNQYGIQPQQMSRSPPEIAQ